MDRFSCGFLAGIIGAVVMDVWSFISHSFLSYAELQFLDWASVLLFGRLPANMVETVISLLAHIAWTGVIGIILAYLMPLITARQYLYKGALLGFVFGFMFLAIPIVFNVNSLNSHATGTVVTVIIGSLLWGIVTASLLRSFDVSPNN